jgi:acetylornithine deacetylase/succinyl-diaminopimelate desuccinylase-like protein
VGWAHLHGRRADRGRCRTVRPPTLTCEALYRRNRDAKIRGPRFNVIVQTDARAARLVGMAFRIPESLMIEQDMAYITDLLQRLVRIDSINPTLDPDGGGEVEIAGLVAQTLDRLGLEVSVLESTPGRPSVVGRLRGDGNGPSLMLNAHYDTVGVIGMAEPFSANIRDGRLYGRGAYDMKGSLTACIGAVESIVRSGIRVAGDILVAAVADEEHSSLGTMEVVERFPVDGAIVTEPTSERVCLAHKGFAWIEVVTRGRAAHGSRPELGIDANLHMGRVLAGLDALRQSLAAAGTHPLLGPASLHAATIEGGTGLSTYAAECRLCLERRTIPGESEEGIITRIEEIIDGLRSADPSFSATVRPMLYRPAFEARAGSALVSILSAEVERETGRTAEFFGDSPWMDSALLAAAGADTVVFGPHGEGAHAAVEWVDLASVHRSAAILARTALAFGQG